MVLEFECSLLSLIKLNRMEQIVKVDTTFPTRLLSFISKVQVNDAMSMEEQEYIEMTCHKMLEQQKEQIKHGQTLEAYFENLK